MVIAVRVNLITHSCQAPQCPSMWLLAAIKILAIFKVMRKQQAPVDQSSQIIDANPQAAMFPALSRPNIVGRVLVVSCAGAEESR